MKIRIEWRWRWYFICWNGKILFVFIQQLERSFHCLWRGVRFFVDLYI
jgi:hypothetical protein